MKRCRHCGMDIHIVKRLGKVWRTYDRNPLAERTGDAWRDRCSSHIAGHQPGEEPAAREPMTFGQWQAYWGPSGLAQFENLGRVVTDGVDMSRPDAVWRLEAMLHQWDLAAGAD